MNNIVELNLSEHKNVSGGNCSCVMARRSFAAHIIISNYMGGAGENPSSCKIECCSKGFNSIYIFTNPKLNIKRKGNCYT